MDNSNYYDALKSGNSKETSDWYSVNHSPRSVSHTSQLKKRKITEPLSDQNSNKHPNTNSRNPSNEGKKNKSLKT